MSEDTQQDIRKLLKTFGVKADEAITGYAERAPGEGPVRLRITLEPLHTDGGIEADAPTLLVIEGEVRR
jgi:hypothetical protein